MTVVAGPLAQMSSYMSSGFSGGPWDMFPVGLPSDEFFEV